MTVTGISSEALPDLDVSTRGGVRLDVSDVCQEAGGRALLQEVSLSIEPGELVAVVGGSGAGKTTLLETMAGLRRPISGSVRYDGAATLEPGAIGFVPQDDIIHRGLPLRRTLRYAARLRMPASQPPGHVDRVVDETLADLELSARADVPVGALSGGQRKRASIAVELLTSPRLFFLDEPTSGLDPATSADVLAVLRRLSARGITVVLTTHDPADIDACDRVVFLAPEGHLAFVGTPNDARRYFEVTDLAQVYRCLAQEGTPGEWAARFADRVDAAHDAPVPTVVSARPPRRVSPIRQGALLTLRNADLLVRSKLTLAVLIGSPMLVISMMAVLFRPGAFERPEAGSLGPVQTIFWLAFAGFFFGLTYGLLQIVGEFSVFRRERMAGLSVAAYLASKIAVLLPLLLAVNVAMLGVLRALDRLPDASAGTYAVLLATLMIESVCALSLGLLTSAAVADPAQATLALPMLCFPQVLFAGAVVPLAEMAAPGQAISLGMANRWAFESLGRGLHIDVDGAAPAIRGYADAFTGSVLVGWVVLAALAALFASAALATLVARTRR